MGEQVETSMNYLPRGKGRLIIFIHIWNINNEKGITADCWGEGPTKL